MWLALGAAAFVPRLAAGLARPPWHDEYFTAWAARLPLAELIAALRLDSGPPLPYLLVKLFTILGLGPLPAARLIAVAAGTGAVLLGALAARRAFGEAAGWWTGALLAAHPLAVAWSCEGRAYALLLLCAAFAWERIGKLAATGTGAVGLALAVAVACWSHGLGLLLALVLTAAALTLAGAARARAVAAVAVGLATTLPWLPVALKQPPASIAWMTSAWRSLPPPSRAVAPVRLLSPLGDFRTALDLPGSPWWIEGAAAALLLALLVAAARARPAPWRPLIGSLLPPAALGTLAALGVPAFYPGRGEALYLVPFLMLVGAGATRSRPARVAGALLVAGAAAMSATAVARWAATPPSSEQRLAAALRDAMSSGGRVVIGGFWRLGIAYHLGGDAGRFTLVNLPASEAAHPGWYDPSWDRLSPGELDRLLDDLRTHPAPAAVVITPGLPTSDALAHVALALGLRPALDVPGARLYLQPTRP